MDRQVFQAYLITCLISGRRYIGITSRSLRERWNEHVYASRKRARSMTIGHAIAKYGPEKFEMIPICSARSWADICAAEVILIEQWNTQAPNGYNLRAGGEGVFGAVRSPESIELSASKHRGKPCHPNTRAAAIRTHLGRPKSIEHRGKISAARVGTTHGSATRAKISASKMGISCNAGTSNGQAKLTAEQVRESRVRLAAGESQRSIARSFGVHYNAIWKIAHGLKWKAV